MARNRSNRGRKGFVPRRWLVVVVARWMALLFKVLQRLLGWMALAALFKVSRGGGLSSWRDGRHFYSRCWRRYVRGVCTVGGECTAVHALKTKMIRGKWVGKKELMGQGYDFHERKSIAFGGKQCD